jgi:hypothetical protein
MLKTMKLSNQSNFLLSFLFLFTIVSCGQIIDDLSNKNILGRWNLISITDVATNKVTDVDENSISTKMLGNNAGNAISFEGENFNIFYQLDGDQGEIDGSFELLFPKLKLVFNSTKVVNSSVSTVSETELILADTLNTKARLLKFVR